ncbi:hypothetical protein ACH79_40025 [Bradyrhizobium sp. CCBAU 051011]|nr:hypothetical protein ACH79_40025 [Bradyrhizobium sp. CCBAU 051011]
MLQDPAVLFKTDMIGVARVTEKRVWLMCSGRGFCVGMYETTAPALMPVASARKNWGDLMNFRCEAILIFDPLSSPSGEVRIDLS